MFRAQLPGVSGRRREGGKRPESPPTRGILLWEARAEIPGTPSAPRDGISGPPFWLRAGLSPIEPRGLSPDPRPQTPAPARLRPAPRDPPAPKLRPQAGPFPRLSLRVTRARKAPSAELGGRRLPDPPTRPPLPWPPGFRLTYRGEGRAPGSPLPQPRVGQLTQDHVAQRRPGRVHPGDAAGKGLSCVFRPAGRGGPGKPKLRTLRPAALTLPRRGPQLPPPPAPGLGLQALSDPR